MPISKLCHLCYLKFCLICEWIAFNENSSALTGLFGHICGKQLLEGVDDAGIRDDFLGKQVHVS